MPNENSEFSSTLNTPTQFTHIQCTHSRATQHAITICCSSHVLASDHQGFNNVAKECLTWLLCCVCPCPWPHSHPVIPECSILATVTQNLGSPLKAHVLYLVSFPLSCEVFRSSCCSSACTRHLCNTYLSYIFYLL